MFFFVEYVIKGQPGYDPQSFFNAIRQQMLEFLREKPNYKIEMILNCKAKTTDLLDMQPIGWEKLPSEMEFNREATDKE